MLVALMSLHQNGSTSSNPIKPEDEGDDELSGVPQLAQPPTTLLNLPDDILYLIMEEVYEARYNSSVDEDLLHVAAILINKRIFSLAQSIWFRRLTINASLIDLRLSYLHVHDTRRTALRYLSLAFTEPYPNLFKSVLLRLPRLTHLTIQVPDDLTPQASSGLLDGVVSLTTLQHLTLQTTRRARNYLTQLANDCIKARPRSDVSLSLERGGVSFYDVVINRATSLKCLKVSSTGGLLSRDHWLNLFSLELHNGEDALKWEGRFLEAFRDAITHDGLYSDGLQEIARTTTAHQASTPRASLPPADTRYPL
ncbi:hypothetical protein JCM5353_007257 [Sporobolomyces roseus]